MSVIVTTPQTASEGVTTDLSEQLLDLEAQIERLQDDKKAIYESARDTYGKRYANALKLALKIKRTDEKKLAEADEVDAEAFRILAIINKPRAPRATRTREIIEEFDAETGEITEPQPPVSAVQMHIRAGSAPTAQHGVSTSLDRAEGIADGQPIQPETANEASGEIGHAGLDAADHGLVETGSNASSSNAGGSNVVATSAHIVAGEGAHNASVTPPNQIVAGSSNGRTAAFDAADAGSTPAPASTFTPKPLRAHCLKPHACGGQGKQHCWGCTQAMSKAGEVA